MKKVTLEEINTINIKDINNQSSVGILWGLNKKTIVFRKSYHEYISIGILLDIESTWSAKGKKEYIEEVIDKNEDAIIYVFDSNKELLEWLIY